MDYCYQIKLSSTSDLLQVMLVSHLMHYKKLKVVRKCQKQFNMWRIWMLPVEQDSWKLSKHHWKNLVKKTNVAKLLFLLTDGAPNNPWSWIHGEFERINYVCFCWPINREIKIHFFRILVRLFSHLLSDLMRRLQNLKKYRFEVAEWQGYVLMVTVMLVTSLYKWLYHGDWFQMLVVETLCWRLFSLWLWFLQYIKSVTNISNLSPTHLVSNIRHQHRFNRFDLKMFWLIQFFRKRLKDNCIQMLKLALSWRTIMPMLPCQLLLILSVNIQILYNLFARLKIFLMVKNFIAWAKWKIATKKLSWR